MQLEVLALDPDGRPMHISQVPASQRGKRCTAVCAHCGKRLWAKLGEKRAWHFAHPAGEACGLGTESALHVAAKEILESRLVLATPPVDVTAGDTTEGWLPGMTICFTQARVEHRLDGLIPDVVLARDDKPDFLVEIRLTHPCSTEKIQRIETLGLPCLEVDVRHIRLDSEAFDRDALERLLTEEHSREHKSWLFVPGLVERQHALSHQLEQQARQAQEAAARDREMKQRLLRERAQQAEAERVRQMERESRWARSMNTHPVWISNRTRLGLRDGPAPQLMRVIDIPGIEPVLAPPTAWQSQVWIDMSAIGVNAGVRTGDLTTSIRDCLPNSGIDDLAVGSYLNRLAGQGIVQAIPPHYSNDPASWVWRILRLPYSTT